MAQNYKRIQQLIEKLEKLTAYSEDKIKGISAKMTESEALALLNECRKEWKQIQTTSKKPEISGVKSTADLDQWIQEVYQMKSKMQ